jgi:hypothetical protein
MNQLINGGTLTYKERDPLIRCFLMIEIISFF